MQTVWKVHRGFVYKLRYDDDAACWSVDVKPRHGRAIVGLSAASATDFGTLADAEQWAESWIRESTSRLAAAL